MSASFAAGWRQVGACLVLMATSAMVASTYSLVAVPLGREFGTSRMVLMLAMTVMSGASGAMSPLFGNLMDRVSLRRLMGLGAFCLVAGFVALSYATSFLAVLVIYGVLMAASMILIGPMPAMVLLSRWFVARRGTALGIAISGVALGSVVFPPVIQALLDHFEWREALRWLALILLVCTLPAVLAIVNSPADKGLNPDGAATPSREHAAHAGQAPLSTRDVLTDPAFWMVGLMLAVVLSGMMGLVTNMRLMAEDHGVASGAAALLVSIYAATGFVAKLAFAGFADRMNPRHLALLVLGLFGAGMACLLRADAGYAVIALGVGLVGLGGVMIPLQGLLVPRIFGLRVVGKVSGLLNLIVLMALLATPPVFGRIYDVTGGYDAGFILFAALAVVMMAMIPFIRMHPRRLPQENGEAAAEPAR